MAPETKRKRLIEAAAAILEFTPQKKLNIVVLNKALFYLDLACLRDFGQPMSDNTFIALRQGPVVAKYPQRLIKAMSDEGIADQETTSGDAQPIALRKSLDHFEFINDHSKRVIQNIALWFSTKTSNEASEFAHENLGWKIAYQEGQGKNQPPKPINLHIAMQQIIDSDPWMDSDYVLSQDSISAADRDEGVPW